MRREDFHYDLPRELIAQAPSAVRSASRLLALDGREATLRDLWFRDLPGLLNRCDLLVFNDTRVIPARVFGAKSSGGRVEILLERVESATTALVHARSSKTLRPQGTVELPGGCVARMVGRDGEFFRLEFSQDVLAFFEAHGSMPLPPYIDRAPDAADRERYQTVFARERGAVAAPTAGLHFDDALFAALDARGVRGAFLTLHVGAGTFAPLREGELDRHVMHAEVVDVPQSVCEAIEETRATGGRVVAVGTTVVRALEAAAAGGRPRPLRGETRIFIKPGHRFHAVDAMVTNFHLPESTLLMLCAAFAGREAVLDAYRHAVREKYRFFSYGDAMFLTPGLGTREGT